MAFFTQPPEDPTESGPFELIDALVQGLVQGASLPELDARALKFVQAHLSHLPELAEDRRLVLALVRQLQHSVPLPARQWRPHPVARPERNALCYCGSGQKYKHCCAEFEHMPLPLEPDMLLALAISHAPPEYLQPQPLRRLPPMGLAQVASLWLEQNQAQRVVDTLLPLFEQPELLDERHEMALDFLFDAMLQQGLNTQRLSLMRSLAESPVLALATTARCRHVSHLADQGDYTAAWALFRQTQREDPDNIQLLHLELVTLLSEGRAEEARLRAPLLAARARRMGHQDMADILAELGEQGLDAMGGLMSDDPAWMWLQAEVLPHWQALLERIPTELDAAKALSLYECPSSAPDEQGGQHIHLQPKHALQLLNRRWQRRFKVHRPDEGPAQLGGDASALLDDAAEMLPFFNKNPQAWHSLEVLTDLLIALDDVLELDLHPGQWKPVGTALVNHAQALLRLLLAPADSADGARATGWQLNWYDPGCQPAARLLGILINLHIGLGQDALPLIEWSLALEPNDPLGWRHVLVDQLINQQRWDEARQCLDRFPHDMPPAGHRLALVLYALGQQDAARQQLEQAHAEYPAFMLALWPEVLDPPADEGHLGMVLGGAEHAFQYRETARRSWVESGALAWSHTLGLSTQIPATPKRGKTEPKQNPKAPQTPTGLAEQSAFLDAENWQAQRQKLRKSHDWPRLHGFLIAVAWTPGLIQPGTWLPVALQMRHKAWPKTEAAHHRAINADLTAIVAVSNHLTQALNQQAGQSPLPLEQVLDVPRALSPRGAAQVSAAELQRWAAGFVHACELAAPLWKNAGHPVQAGQRGKSKRSPSLAQLYELAAGAPPLPDIGLGGPAWQAHADNGQALLPALDLQDTAGHSVRERLQQALRPLWHSVLPIHQARVRTLGDPVAVVSSFEI